MATMPKMLDFKQENNSFNYIHQKYQRISY